MQGIFLLLVILTILVSLSGVSAAADVYVATNGSDSNNGTRDSPFLTIGQGVASVDANGTVNIADGVYSGTGNVNISINKNLNIRGASQAGTIINGENMNGIFIIPAGVNVRICNLTLTNGNNTTGGAIVSYGNLTVNYCTFTSNTAGWNGTNTNYGGAINNQGSLTVNNSLFHNNTARVGGAIYNSPYSTLNVNNSIFINNAGKLGGAIYNHGISIVKGSSFTNNTAQRGGAIFNLRHSLLTVDFIVDNCIFTDNNASFGGAFYNNYGNVTVRSSTFTGNSVNGTYGRGGAVFNEGEFNVNCSTFVGNRAISGGAIYNWETLTVDNCNFTDNIADNGGAIYNNQSNVVSVTGSNFSDNNASGDGGAIYFSGETLNIMGCNFNKNTAGDYGGAIYIEGYGEGNYAVNAKYSRFVGNMVGTTAQDIYLNGFGTTVDFRYNWWGFNDGPVVGRIAQIEGTPSNEIYSPWLFMKINADPSTIYAGTTSKITANVYTDSEGTDHSADMAQFFSGPEVTFTTNLGNVGSKSVTVDWILGTATAILRGDEGPGTASLTATDDAQTGNTTVTILQAPDVNAASTVGMKDTGFPMEGLILAILAVLGGFLASKRK